MASLKAWKVTFTNNISEINFELLKFSKKDFFSQIYPCLQLLHNNYIIGNYGSWSFVLPSRLCHGFSDYNYLVSIVIYMGDRLVQGDRWSWTCCYKCFDGSQTVPCEVQGDFTRPLWQTIQVLLPIFYLMYFHEPTKMYCLIRQKDTSRAILKLFEIV